MKKKLLFASLVMACFSAQSSTDPTEFANELKNHTFLLKVWPQNGQDRCMQYDYDYDYGERVVFNSCFEKSSEQYIPLKQMFMYDNGRIIHVEGKTPLMTTCLKASNSQRVIFDSNCSDDTSKFDIIPFNDPVAPISDRTNRFLIKSKLYGTCLQQAQLGDRTKSILTECRPSYEDQLFGAVLKTPMISLEVKNLNKHSRHVIVDVHVDNLLTFSTKLEYIASPRTYYAYIPDFRSYRQEEVEHKVRTDSSKWPTKDFSGFQLRAGEKGKITVDNKKYEIDFKQVETDVASISTDEDEGMNMDYTFTEDQLSLKPYAIKGADYNIPEDWVVMLYSKENYLAPNPSTDALVWFGVQGGEPPEVTKPFDSLRILNKNDGKTFLITNERGKLGFDRFSNFVINGIQEKDGKLNNRGLYSHLATSDRAWRKGNILCDKESLNAKCAMLKTGREAQGKPFTDHNHWYPFPIKSYSSRKDITKGEIFYGVHKPVVVLFYAKKDGRLPAPPNNLESNANWQVMGYFKDLVDDE